MRQKSTWAGLFVVLLIGITAVAGWRLYRPERLLRSRAARILDYRHEKPETQSYWLDEHTLLLVISDSPKYHQYPSEWTGRVQRLNTRTGKRTPDEGLTRMLNSLQAEPLNCEPAPGGRWLLWTVAETPDHYPGNLVSPPDGSQHYDWPADKFEEKMWVNACQWVHHRRHAFTDDPATDQKAADARLPRPPVSVEDVRHPKQKQELAANSPQVHALLTAASPDGMEYAPESEGENFPPSGWHLAVYSAFDFHIRTDAEPLRTLPLHFPFVPQYANSVTSPDHRRIVYELTYEQSPPLPALLHRFIPSVHAPVQKVEGMWVSNVDGSDLHEIGHILSTDQNTIQRLQWLPDSRHVSWYDEDGLYMATAE